MSLNRYTGNDLVSDIFRDPFFSGGVQNYLPATDVRETSTTYHIEANTPGFRKEDIQVDLDESGKYITIHGKHTERHKDDGSRFHRVERRMADFTRSFRVPPGCDTSKIRARMEDGVLCIDIPKHQQTTSPKRSITIQ